MSEDIAQLLADDALELLAELLELVSEVAGGGRDAVAQEMDELLGILADVVDGREGDLGRLGGRVLGAVAAVVDDVGVVGRTTAVPGEELGGC